jgi:hypothetical protein
MDTIHEIVLPGNTDLSSYNKFKGKLPPLGTSADNRRAIILATNDVNDITLFLNGLTQNIVILYDLFECLGYKSYLLQYSVQGEDKKEFIKRYRTITPQDIIKNPIPIHAFIEIGMSLDSITRGYLRSIGSKIVKLYLGNILNIDIETIQNYSNMFFNHHLVGEIDEIWTSPHYKQHVDYAAILNRVDIKNGKVVPYVWDPLLLTQYGSKDTIEWIPIDDWRQMDIVIMDPNISFQKCFFYSLLLVEAFSRKYPEWRGKVQIINGDKINITANAKNWILPSLNLFKSGRINLHGRKNIHTILKENRSACFMTHQWNNDFNYMTLELLYADYPILHNSEGWDAFGYHYDINKWNDAIEVLHKALTTHRDNLNIYRSHAANLIWKHSIHNPEIQEEWRQFL